MKSQNQQHSTTRSINPHQQNANRLRQKERRERNREAMQYTYRPLAKPGQIRNLPNSSFRANVTTSTIGNLGESIRGSSHTPGIHNETIHTRTKPRTMHRVTSGDRCPCRERRARRLVDAHFSSESWTPSRERTPTPLRRTSRPLSARRHTPRPRKSDGPS